MAEKLGNAEDWAKYYRSLHLGGILIDLAVAFAQFDGKPVFQFTTIRDPEGEGPKAARGVTFTSAAADWIAANESALESMFSPAYLPMTVPPLPWEGLTGGGYLNIPLELLKRGLTKRDLELFGAVDLTAVLSAVNAMQNTAWRINKDIYRYMREAWGAGYLFFGLDSHTLERLPPRLEDGADPEDIRARARERSEAFKRNNRIKELGRNMSLLLSLAERLVEEAQLFYTYQLDHRGRAYPVYQLIHPQADSTARSLLEFKDGKPLGESGAYWLAIHLANCYLKKNKVSFDELRDWVRENDQEIIAFAANPMREHRFWHEADKPWPFLRACLDWKGYREQGPEFCSHLPISMDGTCNGYQHLSAMGRDPIGGRATNLVPGEVPRDIYQEVADPVAECVRIDAETPGPNQEAARQLLGRIDRSSVKPPTMTTPYGVKLRRIYRQLLESDAVKGTKNPKTCARYLAKVVRACIPKVAVEATKIMNWARDITRRLAKANRGMVWTLPTGFLVRHEARVQKKMRLATADHTLVIYVEDESRKIDPRKQVDGVVAHLVHSYDAAHMMSTVNQLVAAGIYHFAMIHDSYGVHACDIDKLNRVLREEFVRIHLEPVLQKFLDELRAANPDIDLPDVPELGDLDIRQVLSSPYFFA